MKRYLLGSLLLVIFASFCFASLTIFFKDGTSKEVHKITFRGSVAELYLVDGDVITVPVEKLDLPSSGIGAAVGTYGTSRVTGQRVSTEKKGVLGSPMAQTRLREEWERAEKSATVVNSIGPMQRGDTVKIVGETTPSSRPSRDDYYDESEYEYNPATGRYTFKAKNLDHAYVIVYKNQDGSFGKRLFDAVAFNAHFKIGEVTKTPAPMPEYPIIPDKKDPHARETNPFSTSKSETPAEPVPAETESQEQVSEQAKPVASESEEIEQTSRRRSMISFLIFVAVVVAMGFGAWLLINRSQKPYIDTSKFSRYEEDLKEFEIAIWLRNGKTTDQLMEICLKKFFQDNPSLLMVCSKMLKGSQKGLMAPFIAKQTGRSMVEAERIYDQIHNQIERVRGLIREVSAKTGITPAKPAVDVSPKSAPELPKSVAATKESIKESAPLPKQAPAPAPPPMPRQAVPVAQQPEPSAPQVASAGNATSSFVLNASPDKPSSHLIEPESPMRTAADLPAYANSVLNQISFLSSPEDK